MQTANLIEQLAGGVARVQPRPAVLTLAPGLVAGAAVTAAAVLGLYGVQPGLTTVEHGAPFAMKLAYAGMIALVAGAFAAARIRPGQPSPRRWWLLIPVALLAALALSQLGAASGRDWPTLLLGGSWTRCPWRVAALSLPIYAGLVVAARQQAPTDLRRAGAAVGLLAGAIAAALYALACTENSAAFVLVWYSLGIALATGIGALTGPKLLRW